MSTDSSTSTKSCEPCPISNCAYCLSDSLSECQRCKLNFFLSSDKTACVRRCTDDTVGYFNVSYEESGIENWSSCVEECPDGYYLSKYEQSCLNCHKSASKCYGPTEN